MPLLLYCVTATHDSTPTLQSGVGGSAVEEVEHSGLRCFFSRISGPNEFEGAIRESALQFHAVLQQLFRNQAVIPFRFPTFLQDDSELAGYLRQHSGYHASLARLRDLVQMEIRISYQESAATAPTDTQGGDLEKSGSKYLRDRQARKKKLEAAAEQFHQAGHTWIGEWRTRQSQDKIRCFALVNRSSVRDFEHALANVQVPADLTVRITGPWPASEFVDNP